MEFGKGLDDVSDLGKDGCVVVDVCWKGIFWDEEG